MEQLHGKEMGYNNIRDLDAAWKAACAFVHDDDVTRLLPGVRTGGKACCVAIKHNTPCGIALAETLLEAYEKTYACDPVSIYGGIVASNKVMDAKTAFRLNEIFLEVVAAPDFEEGALELLKQKKNLRIIKLLKTPAETHEYVAVDGGMLVQQTDRRLLEKWEVVTKKQPEDRDISDMLFGLKAVTFVKSNAIMVVKEQAATGIGGGQVNRIWPAVHALEQSAFVMKKASEASHDTGGSPWADSEPARVLASDAFFPFADIVEAAAKAGIKTIIQPGGSINDKLSIEACDKHGIAMVFTGTRHFKH
jgi:phosphoribosylaminoimidazolecarboxamide formyltransferase/IMP cyclohydrolase